MIPLLPDMPYLTAVLTKVKNSNTAVDVSRNCLYLDLFGYTAAILNSTVRNSYCGMLRGQIHTNLPLSIS